MTDWQIFTIDGKPHDNLKELPPAPPWRPFGRNAALTPPPHSKAGDDENLDYALARSFRATSEMVDAVNTALYLRRPLLVTGKPGNGKSSLIRAVARQLRLGPVLRWSVTSKSTLKEGLYLYDALGRLDRQRTAKTEVGGEDSDIGDFIELGPLGTALLPAEWPKALLIDEIDKSDLDLPNDLLNIFEEGEYSIPELARARVKDPEGKVMVRTWRRLDTKPIKKGHVRCTHFPFVLMTSNREREFPAAFLRRCVRIEIKEPTKDMLADIVASHFGDFTGATKESAENLIQEFLNNRASKDLATDQLLNAIYLVLRSGKTFSDKDALVKELYKPITGPEATR